MTSSFHEPVLADVVRTCAAGATRAVDGTAGGGGHTAVLRDAGAQVLAIDRDPAALETARARLGDEGIEWLAAPFGSPAALARVRAFRPDRILLDLGVSSHQLDAESRGFTFRPGAPLDMRMTPGAGASAADLLNTWGEDRLAETFADDADEPRARRLARIVVRRRERGPFLTSDDFVNAIREALGPRSGPGDFARLFQALRMAVNGERDQLTRALPAFREWGRDCVCPPGQPICTCRGRALGRVLTRKAVMPEAAELARNPRSRSAHFRDFEVT